MCKSADNGRMRVWPAVMVAVAISHALGGTVQISLDARAIGEAIAIGQSRIERDRIRFHAPYRLVVNRPPIDYVDVVSPFRRIVVAAEARARIGDRTFGQRQAFEMLAAAPAEIELYVELTFHPLNTFVGVPDYTVVLAESGTAPVQPRVVERVPRHDPRVEGM